MPPLYQQRIPQMEALTVSLTLTLTFLFEMREGVGRS